jgi:hypothetical protein
MLVLLNMRRRQRQVNEGRRRYQDIFDGTGVALCVLDLSGLRGFFDKRPVAHPRAIAGMAAQQPRATPTIAQATAHHRGQPGRRAPAERGVLRTGLGTLDQRLPV